MWCLKCFGKSGDRTVVLNWMYNNQVFQYWIFIIHGNDELLQTRNRHLEADTTDTMVLFESKD